MSDEKGSLHHKHGHAMYFDHLHAILYPKRIRRIG